MDYLGKGEMLTNRLTLQLPALSPHITLYLPYASKKKNASLSSFLWTQQSNNSRRVFSLFSLILQPVLLFMVTLFSGLKCVLNEPQREVNWPLATPLHHYTFISGSRIRLRHLVSFPLWLHLHLSVMLERSVLNPQHSATVCRSSAPALESCRATALFVRPGDIPEIDSLA